MIIKTNIFKTFLSTKHTHHNQTSTQQRQKLKGEEFLKKLLTAFQLLARRASRRAAECTNEYMSSETRAQQRQKLKGEEYLKFLGYASGIAAGNQGCADGPSALKRDLEVMELPSSPSSIKWNILSPQLSLKNKYHIVSDLSERLAYETKSCVVAHEKFCVIGGDHSSGIGTWSGAAAGLGSENALGLIWIDAHLDAHTPHTSPTGNIHGMPLAALLGYGEASLTHVAHSKPKLLPENLCLLGIRSFEEGEEALLKALNVRIYYIEEIEKRGFQSVFSEALAHVKKHTSKFGVSLDIDGLDPVYTPATGTPVSRGLHLNEVCAALKNLDQDPKFLGLEIAEYNPHEAGREETAKSIAEILKSVFNTFKMP